MRVFIAGVDGYIGWALAQYLAARDYVVSGVDNFQRRNSWVPSVGSDSAIPIEPIENRVEYFRGRFGDQHFPGGVQQVQCEVCDYKEISKRLLEFAPDCIVHLAQMPSAPFSMIDHAHCVYSQENNTKTTLAILWAIKEHLKNAHLLTIGTAGEYGTPGVDIAEGEVDFEYNGRTTKIRFPRMTPSSFYHASKCHSSINIERACAWWGIAATDIMQSVVFGTRHQFMDAAPGSMTRFDFDECFGTAINRFAVQAVMGVPLTVYGIGKQKRGFIPLRDSVKCLELLIKTPAQPGEYRVVNQYDDIYSINDLAEIVSNAAGLVGINCSIEHIENPRFELEDHYYKVEMKKLRQLGYEHTVDISREVTQMINDILPHRDRIEKFVNSIKIGIKW